MHSVRRGLGTLAVGSLAISGLGAPAAFADPTPAQKYVVADASEWKAQAYSVAGVDPWPTTQSDGNGPGHAPFGPGSHQLTIGTSDADTQLYRTAKYDGKLLSDITRLEYSTYAHSTGDGAPPRQPTYLRLSVDTDGTEGYDTSLYFFPADNAGEQAVKDDVWQSWDVANGRISVDGDNGPNDTTTLAEFAAAHPAATIVNPNGGGLALLNGGAQGGAGDTQVNGVYNVDRVIVGAEGTDTLFDFGTHAEAAGDEHLTAVNDQQLVGWVHTATSSAGDAIASDQQFVRGPGTPPSGVGSLKFTISDSTDAGRVEQFRTGSYDGRYLRDLRALDFRTYQHGNAGNDTPQQPAYLRLNLDDNGDGSVDEHLYYIPANNAQVQAVAQGTWQTWPAAAKDAKWSLEGDNGPDNTVTLTDYLVQHPDAKIANKLSPATPQGGGVAFVVGAGAPIAAQDNGEYFLDKIHIALANPSTATKVNGLVYDLEPAPRITIGDVRIREGNDGSVLSFPVKMDTIANRKITLNFGTSDGSALSGKDYVARTGTVTIPVGEKTTRVNIRVLSDMVRENDEKMTVTIGDASYGTISRDTATGTIVNDDTTVGLSLSRATAHRVRVHVATVPAAKGSHVTVYRIVKGSRVRVLSTTLDKYGKVSALLGKQYTPGTKVTFVATVRTAAGTYTSPAKRITIR